MLFHFEYHREDRWEAFGSGVGRGEDEGARLEALHDLNGLAGGTLPAGTYRCIAATSGSTRWDSLRLDAEGKISFDDGEPAEVCVPAPSV